MPKTPFTEGECIAKGNRDRLNGASSDFLTWREISWGFVGERAGAAAKSTRRTMRLEFLESCRREQR